MAATLPWSGTDAAAMTSMGGTPGVLTASASGVSLPRCPGRLPAATPGGELVGGGQRLPAGGNGHGGLRRPGGVTWCVAGRRDGAELDHSPELDGEAACRLSGGQEVQELARGHRPTPFARGRHSSAAREAI